MLAPSEPRLSPPQPHESRPSAWRARASDWLRAFVPEPVGADWRERIRVVVGATLGILVAAWVSHALSGDGAAAWPWLVAPMGASAVLVFAVPASPLAQPWAVLGGNTISALVGVACVRLVDGPEVTAALAVGLAIGVMFVLRCLHPPGGASALLVALTGVTDPGFALAPVLINSALLVAVGVAYNTVTGRPYPHRLGAPRTSGARDTDADAVDADLDAVLARYNRVLDIGREDLKALLEDTQLSAYQRKLSDLRCSDVMSPEPVTVRPRTPQREAWPLFRRHRIKALPVIDAAGRVVGIVTPADFMRAAEVAADESLAARLRTLRNTNGGVFAGQTVGALMTREVCVARSDRHLADMVPLFASTGHHHVPIVDAEQRLVGILTQSDVVKALTELTATSG